jgi:S1-C subfamily serine protease
VHSGTQLRNTIGLSRIGDEVNLTIDRGGAERALGVKVELAAKTPVPKSEPER